MVHPSCPGVIISCVPFHALTCPCLDDVIWQISEDPTLSLVVICPSEILRSMGTYMQYLRHLWRYLSVQHRREDR